MRKVHATLAAAAGAAAVLTVAVVAWCRRPPATEPPPAPPPAAGTAVLRVGFNGGPDRAAGAIGVSDPDQRRRALEDEGFTEARITHAAGGNMLRAFYQSALVLGESPCPEADHLFHRNECWYQLPVERRLALLDGADARLTAALDGVARGVNPRGEPLRLADLDAYLAGVERFNHQLPDPSGAVRVLLTSVENPPRWAIEAPPESHLRQAQRPYTFRTLWDKYVRLQADLTRLLVRRYAVPAGPAGRPRAVCAFEVVNEPDYEWLPDEMRIEKSANPAANPLGKYVTELHLSMIPQDQGFNGAVEKTPWGYQAQDAEWGRHPRRPVPLREFDWGAKFDWYARCYAELLERVSFAARDEATRGGARVHVVAGSVTHCNLDFLTHLHRLNPNAFAHVDVVGVHPYHWVRHDIWDKNFVSAAPKGGWRGATPREYARDYFKRFDFLEEVAKLTRATDPAASHGLAGKRIWVTEFGIPTKKLGKANRELKDYIKFIRQRKEPELEVPSAVWEDLWDAFFAQVDRAYLERHGVDVLLLYALREAGVPHFDLDDEDRSNLAIFDKHGAPRMHPDTHARMVRLFRSLSRRPAE